MPIKFFHDRRTGVTLNNNLAEAEVALNQEIRVARAKHGEEKSAALVRFQTFVDETKLPEVGTDIIILVTF